MAYTYAHVYLSPHFDDASLSCGGAIHSQVEAGQPVLVVTICAASPEPAQPLSAFAAMLHQSWGSPADMVAMRQAEDQASMAVLGVDYLRLGLADCIYRGRPEAGTWYYTSDAAIFGQVHPAELGLAGTIVEAVEELVPADEATVLYAPLAVGNHVDHQLAHAAAWQLRQQGWTIAFYEDYPYADPNYPFTRPAYAWEQRYTLAATLTARHSVELHQQLRYLSETNLRAKFDSVLAYRSQWPLLFGGERATEQILRDYALHVGAGRLAERVWRPD